MPNIKMLESIEGIEKWDISQCYLLPSGRLRKVTVSNSEKYFFTEKKRINAIKRIENEREIEKSEYLQMQKQKNQAMNEIEKTRYRIPKDGFVYEIDIFPFYKNIAFLEVELETELQQFPIPDFVNIIKEVTQDNRLTNYSLSKNIPDENTLF